MYVMYVMYVMYMMYVMYVMYDGRLDLKIKTKALGNMKTLNNSWSEASHQICP